MNSVVFLTTAHAFVLEHFLPVDPCEFNGRLAKYAGLVLFLSYTASALFESTVAGHEFIACTVFMQILLLLHFMSLFSLYSKFFLWSNNMW
jgi:hypothetical protein